MYSGDVGRRLVERASQPAGPGARPFPELTDRETEILGAVAAGRSNHEIAQRLYLSEKTVRNNVSAILASLQVADRSAAIVQAREAGLGSRTD